MTAVESGNAVAAVSATGGSARSQLGDVSTRSWKPRPLVGLTIVGLAFLVPVVASVIAVQISIRLVTRPDSAAGFVVWMIGLTVLATSTMWLVDRLSRRMLPLAAMLRLSLVFPDRAPSRFSVALKAGSGKALDRSIERSSTESEFATSEDMAILVTGLVRELSTHDRRTRGHCERVRAYADLIGEELELDAESRSKLHWAALLHDVGKLDVPASILNKTERLTPAEWNIVRRHPGSSVEWLAPLREWLGEWALAASQHHERYDGDGYPDGVKGDDISLAGRIVAVADAFDVMTAARSYKKPYPAAQARVELANNAGTQFDPRVVRAFLSVSLGRLRLVMGPLAWLSSWSGLFSAGGVVSAVMAGVTAAFVAVSALAAPAAASVTGHHSHAQSALAAPQSSGAGGSAPTPGAGGQPASAATQARQREADRRAGKPVDGTVPVEVIGADDSSPPSADGSTGGGATAETPTSTPARGSSRGHGHRGDSDGGDSGGGSSTVITTPGDTTPDTTPGDTTPDTTPGDTTPATTPATTPPTTPATTPVTTPVVVTTPTTVHHAPIANNDTTGSLLKANVAIDVLFNDSDPDGNLSPASLQLVSLPPSGYKSITVSNGKINVHVALLYTGTLVFTYKVCDTTGLCSQATVTAKFTLAAL